MHSCWSHSIKLCTFWFTNGWILSESINLSIVVESIVVVIVISIIGSLTILAATVSSSVEAWAAVSIVSSIVSIVSSVVSIVSSVVGIVTRVVVVVVVVAIVVTIITSGGISLSHSLGLRFRLGNSRSQDKDCHQAEENKATIGDHVDVGCSWLLSPC